MEPEWKEPPAPRAGVTRRKDIDIMVDKLRERPGEWALVSKGASASVASWKSRGCEVKTVSAGLGYKPGRCDTYARWPLTEVPKPSKKRGGASGQIAGIVEAQVEAMPWEGK